MMSVGDNEFTLDQDGGDDSTAVGRAAHSSTIALQSWRRQVIDRARLTRLGGLYTSGDGDDQLLIAIVATADGFEAITCRLEPDTAGVIAYPSITPQVRAAFWYERALHDLAGVIPREHPRLDPLLLPLSDGVARPVPGLPTRDRLAMDERLGPVDVTGEGVFAIPFGPVRSGVMESIELLLETPGEDIPHLNIRPHYKHRGIAKQFEGRTVADGVLVAERVEGISTVAHALAYCHAIESLADAAVPPAAALTRVVYAELERVINHLDVTMRLADTAALAVGAARFGYHKELLMRLVSTMSRSRFARNVVVPGGISQLPQMSPESITDTLHQIYVAIRSDIAGLENSASFLDRLRTTGPLTPELAREHGALGPIGRASGYDDDDRRHRPYDGYRLLAPPEQPRFEAGDAVSRTRVRWREIDSSVTLICDALRELRGHDATSSNQLSRPEAALSSARHNSLRTALDVPDGSSLGWSEAAQGEVLYGLEVAGGHIRRCFARSASFHNMVLFHDVFVGDIFTDLPFIEASFGLSYAGVAM